MSASEHLGTHAEGWTNGNADTILSAVSGAFVFDDPNAGVISADGFAAYMSDMKEMVKAARGGDLPEPHMALTEIVTQESGGVLTAWCCWAVPGTSLKGSGLIKVGDDGVRSEVICYFTKLPD